MSALGWVHTVSAVAALVSGAAVLVRRKGTRAHRRLGCVYVGSVVVLNATALLVYRLFGGFGPFHVAALLSLATIAGGVLPAVRRRPAGRWVERHYWWMTFSYVGLVAAAASEAATRLPGTVFWWQGRHSWLDAPAPPSSRSAVRPTGALRAWRTSGRPGW
jgi:uncharacterized membrane protein